jgi:hypothetical protein
MANPNNNKNFNDEALRINRALKKDNDLLKEEIEALWIDLTGYEKRITELKERLKEKRALSEIVDECEDFLLNVNTQWEDDKQSERLQQMIINVRSRDGK